MSLALIQRQLALKNKQVKPEPDLAALIKQAVADALADAGVTLPPKPQQESPQPRTEPTPPLPLVVPPPAAAAPQRPLPKQLKVQRDELGRVKAMHAEPDGPTFSFRRDELGRVDLVLIDGTPARRWLYGADGETVVGSVPADHSATRYNGKAVPPASLNARST